MSIWTHVSGCIRVDGMPQLGAGVLRDPTHDYKAVLGTPSTNAWLDDPTQPIGQEYENGKNIPAGSEGTIQYAVIDAGNGLVWKTIAVWGDLRDYGAADTREIDEWFQRIVSSPLMLRSAELLVETENDIRYLLVADVFEKSVRRVVLTAPPAHATA